MIELMYHALPEILLRCSDCGAEIRHTYNGTGPEAATRAAELAAEIARSNPHYTESEVRSAVEDTMYCDFVADCIDAAEDEHAARLCYTPRPC